MPCHTSQNKQEPQSRDDWGSQMASQAGIEPASAAPEATALSIRPLGRAKSF